MGGEREENGKRAKKEEEEVVVMKEKEWWQCLMVLVLDFGAVPIRRRRRGRKSLGLGWVGLRFGLLPVFMLGGDKKTSAGGQRSSKPDG
eukprot:evm.model.NODE_23672_length_14876_cov_51.171417.1